MKKSKNNISNWLKEHGDSEIDKFIEKNLAITEKARLATTKEITNYYNETFNTK